MSMLSLTVRVEGSVDMRKDALEHWQGDDICNVKICDRDYLSATEEKGQSFS